MFDFNHQGNNNNNKNNNNNINDMLSFLGGSSLGGGQKKKFTFFEDDFSKKKSHEDKSQSSFQNSQNNYIFRSFSYQEDKNLKYRQSMEDIGVMLPDFIPEKKYSLFGIFDGHGGNDVVKYIKNRLPEIIKANITKNNNYDSIENNLTSSFHKIDEELKFYDSEHTGSTATILLFQDNIVYCANVGDSTAFIVYDNFIKKISIDHKCTDPKEEERILLSGGKITKNRVMGQLVLSRCLGDLYCKKYGVSNIPDISVNKLEGNVKYVVVASDGVWDVVKENELLQLSKNRKNAEGFCKDLVKLAIDKDTKDNVSCIVISFDS